ncbi:16S rRNA (uracil(1498)-N(3))-methyltransferase [Campylobacter sp. MIT 12-8780]|uniref:16S rRNA (uracil(1498)-N(3))-methyltransferase n=1 Tax=unclassified Campylobacter TaxID=2593542 RepID=UPI00115F11D2|nr:MULTISPECIES: 16S rRNA (uracil(1498)-N(3))-methyltransferase [unclassified Campylobacter]NDJ27042.1 16S rRNA (uracil(1498)-N(3))-methyltransferase [Campylobacter sp. MIT 19-121]TQR41657.1 16S rRNA (uracil(1498)-N(3))-methyltransferase [Campylobacter sp. MIT 12-8780]
MQFLYHEKAGEARICLENEAFLHLKARRAKLNESLKLRNLNDIFLYEYTICEFDKKHAVLELKKSEEKPEFSSGIRLALAMIDTGVLEKTLPILNELGLEELLLVYADFSQRNFKLDLGRLRRILIASCEQCGRASLMKISVFKSSDEFKKAYAGAILLDFEGEELKSFSDYKKEIFFIGAEGGFSQRERELFAKKVKLTHPYILKSQSAAISVLANLSLG